MSRTEKAERYMSTAGKREFICPEAKEGKVHEQGAGKKYEQDQRKESIEFRYLGTERAGIEDIMP